MRLQTLAQDWAWMQQHAGLTAAITVAAVLALWALTRAIRAATRRLHLDTVLRAIATPGTLIWEAQGTYVLARGMGMPTEIALAGCTITSTAVVVLAHQAHRHFKRHQALGPAGRYTWYVAAPMGLAVALTQHTIAYGFARVVVPLMAVLLWYSQYAPDEPAGQRRTRKRGRWIWTPERVLVAAGLLAPTAEDLADSNATLRSRKLKRHGNGLHHGPAWLRAWHGSRLRRIAEGATDAEVREAQRSVTRVHTIEAATAPLGVPAERLVLRSGWWLAPWRAARSTARANGALRAEHTTAERSATAALRAEQSARAAERSEAEQTVARTAEALRSLRSDIEAMAAQHAAALAEMRAEHAADLAAAQRQRAERSTGAERPGGAEHRSGAPRSGALPGGAPRRSGADGEAERPGGAPRLSDADAVELMLRTHPGADYDWGAREINKLTGAGFGRIPKLREMVADHHARHAGRAHTDLVDDEEPDRAVAAG